MKKGFGFPSCHFVPFVVKNEFETFLAFACLT
jgi:hypothetical protein